MSDDPLTDCPECGGHVHRIVQPVGVIFKGSGFYVTDNRQSSSSTLAPPKEADKSKTETPAGEETTAPTDAKKTASKKQDD